MTPLVSIIIPAFNEEKNIARILESIKNQTYKNIESIVIDDSSKDKTTTIAKKYTKHVYTQKHAERSIQRNFGAEKSKGKYLLFLDADMQLMPDVISECINLVQSKDIKIITLAEKTVGEGFIPKVRQFERQMYENDPTVEVSRFFERKVFFDLGGYDKNLTGPEDYDLSYRASKLYKSARTNKNYILHYEEGLTLARLLKKKYYYASRGATYANKHPELVLKQGTIIFRAAYLKHWRKFIANPYLGISFVVVRVLETFAAVSGYISSVGFSGFLKTLFTALKGK